MAADLFILHMLHVKKDSFPKNGVFCRKGDAVACLYTQSKRINFFMMLLFVGRHT